MNSIEKRIIEKNGWIFDAVYMATDGDYVAMCRIAAGLQYASGDPYIKLVPIYCRLQRKNYARQIKTLQENKNGQ